MTESIVMLRCPHCSHQSVLGYSDKVGLLRRRGSLRREKNPDPSLVDALFEAALASLPCGQCGSLGLQVETLEEEQSAEFWGERRRCSLCQEPIPAERLEIFPDADRCASCQASGAAGSPDEGSDFCPRCGDRLTLGSSGSGLTRFVTRCSGCGYRG